MLSKIFWAKLGPTSFSTHWLPSSNQAWPWVGSHCVIDRLPGLAQLWAKVFFKLPTLGLALAKLVCHTLAAELWPSFTHCWKAFALPSSLLSRACWAKLPCHALAAKLYPCLEPLCCQGCAKVFSAICQRLAKLALVCLYDISETLALSDNSSSVIFIQETDQNWIRFGLILPQYVQLWTSSDTW